MWLFSRKAKAPEVAKPVAPLPNAVRPDSGPQLVRRVEITVEREWTSTVTRRISRVGSEPPAIENQKDEGAQ